MAMAVFPSSSSYALGVFFLVIVSILWTVCSMVVQYLYNDMQFDSPFLIVYIGTSLFSIFLPIRLGYERWGHSACGMDANNIIVVPWRNDVQILSTAIALECNGEGETYQKGLMPSETSSLHDNSSSPDENGVEIIMPAAAEHLNGNEEYHNNKYEPTPSLHSNSSSSISNNSTTNNTNTNDATTNSNYTLSHQDHISMASKVAPLWFLSNYFYALSLQWTSISSSTVLASMGTIFTFMFATFSRFGDETVTNGKLMGVALCFLGGVATTWTDVESEDVVSGEGPDGYLLRHFRYLKDVPQSHTWDVSDMTSNDSIQSLLGDLAGLFSAVGYGAYTVLIRHLCPKDENRMSMQLFFGYIGLWNMIILLPVAIWVLHASSSQQVPWEDGESPPTDDIQTTITWSIFLFILLKGLLDNVISDYLWARAVILTSATVASVGLGLTIPMAFLADAIMGNHGGMQAGEIIGAVFILLGFVLVNVNVCDERENLEEDSEGIHLEEGSLDAHSAHDVDAAILS